MRTCKLCGKGTVMLQNRSHAQNRTPKAFKANIQKITMTVGEQIVSGACCTKCIKRMKKDIRDQKDQKDKQKTASKK